MVEGNENKVDLSTKENQVELVKLLLLSQKSLTVSKKFNNDIRLKTIQQYILMNIQALEEVLVEVMDSEGFEVTENVMGSTLEEEATLY